MIKIIIGTYCIVIILRYMYILFNTILYKRLLGYDNHITKLCESGDFGQGIMYGQFNFPSNITAEKFAENLKTRMNKYSREEKSIYRASYNRNTKCIEYGDLFEVNLIDKDYVQDSQAHPIYNAEYQSQVFKANIYKNNTVDFTIRHDIASGCTMSKFFSELILDTPYVYQESYLNMLTTFVHNVNPIYFFVFLYYNVRYQSVCDNTQLSPKCTSLEQVNHKQFHINKSILKSSIVPFQNTSKWQTILSKTIYQYHKSRNWSGKINVAFLTYMGDRHWLRNNCGMYRITFSEQDLVNPEQISQRISDERTSWKKYLMIRSSHFMQQHFGGLSLPIQQHMTQDDIMVSNVPIMTKSVSYTENVISNSMAQVYLRKKLVIINCGFDSRYDMTMLYNPDYVCESTFNNGINTMTDTIVDTYDNL